MNSKNILFPVIYGFFFFVFYLLPCEEISITDLVFKLSFGNFGNHKAFLGDALFVFLIVIFAHILFGNRIYKSFCNASIYFYVRTKNLKRWFVREILQLFINVFLYYLTILFVILFLSFFFNKINKFMFNDFLFVIYFIVIYALYTFNTCIIINIISIYIDSGIAFTIVESINIICIGLYLFTGDLFDNNFLLNNSYLLKYNPICHLIIGIHKSKLDIMDKYLINPIMQTNLSVSIIKSLIFMFFLIIIGCITISRIELIGEAQEGE